MSLLRYFLDNLWRWKCGLPERLFSPKYNYQELYESEWSPEFEHFMRNRLILGAMRYGRMGHGQVPRGKPVYDRCESIRQRLERYEKTGNAEWLVDIANLALLMFEERIHPNHHFSATDDTDTNTYHDKILKR